MLIAHLPEEEADARATASWRAPGPEVVLHAADLRTRRPTASWPSGPWPSWVGSTCWCATRPSRWPTTTSPTSHPSSWSGPSPPTSWGRSGWCRPWHTHLEDGGCVIVTTSVQAYAPSDHLLDYAATKAALNNLVVNLAQELGPKGTRVNAVAPGPIWTPLIPATMAPEKVEGFGSDTPLGRPGQPVEVAAAYVFLASDEASYVSGPCSG